MHLLFSGALVKCIDRHVGSQKQRTLHPNKPREGLSGTPPPHDDNVEGYSNCGFALAGC